MECISELGIIFAPASVPCCYCLVISENYHIVGLALRVRKLYLKVESVVLLCNVYVP